MSLAHCDTAFRGQIELCCCCCCSLPCRHRAHSKSRGLTRTTSPIYFCHFRIPPIRAVYFLFCATHLSISIDLYPRFLYFFRLHLPKGPWRTPEKANFLDKKNDRGIMMMMKKWIRVYHGDRWNEKLVKSAKRKIPQTTTFFEEEPITFERGC